MKKYNAIVLSGLLFLSSCSGKLDLLPQQEIDGSIALDSDTNIKRVLGGAYDKLSSEYVLGGIQPLFAELLAANGEIMWEGTYTQPREVYTKKMLTTNSYITNMWLDSYAAINISNNILTAINKVNEDDRDRVKGEALLIRAISYFEMTKLFSQPYSAGNLASNPGLPLILTPTETISVGAKVTRSSVEATYTQILKDAIEAEGLLPATNGIYLTKIAANGYLARIYLQMGDYSKALAAADKAITLAAANNLTLTSTYAAAFNNSTNSSEDIFAIQVSEQDGSNDMQLFWSIPDFGGRDGDVSIQDKHLKLYEANDARFKMFYEGAGSIRSGKWKLQYKNLPLLRLAEMYLTRAECNQRLSSQIGATPLADINLIRKRVGLTNLTAITLDGILKERKLELAHEGQAIHDVKRLKSASDGFQYNANELVFPIPSREVNASDIPQNAGY